jgi:hypothetical protein
VAFFAMAHPAGAADLTASQVYARSIDAVCSVVALQGGKPVRFGSGFVVSSEGLVATNQHVVEGASAIQVKCGRQQSAPGTIERTFGKADLVVIRAKQLSVKPLALSTLNPAKLIGQPVYVIGSPAGLEGTISNGLLSGVRNIIGSTLIQISAPISHGSSGGPVLLSDGKVIGIAAAGLAEGQNLNFALPASLLRDAPAPAVVAGSTGASMDAPAPDFTAPPAPGWLSFRWGMRLAEVETVATATDGEVRAHRPLDCSTQGCVQGCAVCCFKRWDHEFALVDGRKPTLCFTFAEDRLSSVSIDLQVEDEKACSALFSRVDAILREKYGSPDHSNPGFLSWFVYSRIPSLRPPPEPLVIGAHVLCPGYIRLDYTDLLRAERCEPPRGEPRRSADGDKF